MCSLSCLRDSCLINHKLLSTYYSAFYKLHGKFLYFGYLIVLVLHNVNVHLDSLMLLVPPRTLSTLYSSGRSPYRAALS